MTAQLRRTDSIIAHIRSRIAARQLAPGDRLPSIRQLAGHMAVSPSTVVEAYDRLAAEGVIQPRRGSGFYVAASAALPFSVAPTLTQLDRAVDPFWVSRQALDADSHAAKPGCGWLPETWMPLDAIRQAMRSLARGDAAPLIDYGVTHGSPALRRLLQTRLAGEGITASAEQIMLTGSGTQAIDLVCRYLLRPGDRVLVDDPCYFNFRTMLRAHQVEAIGIPFGASGPDVDAFATALSAHSPRLYITNAGLHNPTGGSISPQTAHRIVALAAAHGLIIVEDDIFADFEDTPAPRLAALDGLEHVIRIGSFSKSLSASLRCGYIIARPDWIADLIDLQIATAFGGPSPVAAEVIAQILTGGGYRKHMEDVRRKLSTARRQVSAQLSRLGIEPIVTPRGGFYLWCRLPDGRDAADVARKALAQGVVLAPGNVFSISENARDLMRFNVTQCDDPQLWAVLEAALN